MATDLNNIKTIVIVMMENRSFDHMLGYLSLPDYGRGDIDGFVLKPESTPENPIWTSPFVVPGPYTPFRLLDPKLPLPNKMDPLHERPNVTKQFGTRADGEYPMNGFVQSYGGKIKIGEEEKPVVMGYYTGEDLPTSHFFSEQFTVCTHWFSSVPAGTQPNRLMAMSGQTKIDINIGAPALPPQYLVYHWLEDHGIRWRVYAEGLPFFSLMPSEWLLLSGHLRPFPELAHDFSQAPDSSFPEVIFVEPRYTNAPHIETPHDDHAPSAVDGGQKFLMQIYAAMTANPGRWANSVLIVTYDEHGGFFDHVSPPNIRTKSPTGSYPPFESLGARVPGYIVSPYVSPRTAFDQPMDHTSILKFLGEKFNGGSYSQDVDDRMAEGLSSISGALQLSSPRADIPTPPATSEGLTTESMSTDSMSRAFEGALAALKLQHPNEMQERFPKLFSHF